VTRSRPTLARESRLWAEGAELVCGLDEVGRGPLAGPVVAAAVILKPGSRAIRGLRDSKILTDKKRQRLARVVRARALAVALGAASVREIDRLNIRRATALAMRRAIARLPLEPQAILLDGLPLPELAHAHEAVVDGDANCQSIAAASVVAKVIRDRLMTRLGARHPAYGWASNMGYGTPEHLAAVHMLGPTPHHRLSFSPVVQIPLPL